MTREIYVPIADSFWESSIMREAASVKFVMLSLIRLGLRPGAHGVIDVDPGIFAASIGEPLADVRRALERLMQPDPASASLDEEGRRIVPVDPARPFRGWRLVNWPKYRGIVHRANDAARKRLERSHGEESNTDKRDTSENVRARPESSGLSENGATNTNTNTKTIRIRTPLTPLRGGPRKRDLERFNKSMTGTSQQHYAQAFKERFGIPPTFAEIPTKGATKHERRSP